MITLEEIISKTTPEQFERKDWGEISQVVSLNREKLGSISRADFIKWGVAFNMLGKIHQLASTNGHPLQSSAIAMTYVCSGATEGIDFSDDGNLYTLQVWESSGELSPVQKQALIDLATHPDPVSPQEIGKVLEGV